MIDTPVCLVCGYYKNSLLHEMACERGMDSLNRQPPKRPSAERPSWDELFMSVAELTASRATCKRAKVGAVVAKEDRVLAAGYNGAPSGMPHCTDVGCDIYYTTTKKQAIDEAQPALTTHCRRAIHAEQNVIGLAARWGLSLEGATWYLWPFGPCAQCELLLITTQPARIVFPESAASSGEHGGVLRVAGVQVDLVSPRGRPLTGTA